MPEESPKPGAVSRDVRFVIAGTLIVFVAGAGFYLSSLPQYLSNEWLRMGSMALGVVGVIVFMFSTMEPAQRRDWVKQGFIALAIALCIRWAIGEPYRIPSASMETALHGDERVGRGDRVFVNKWVYGVRYPFMNKRIWYGVEPQRWDIVVFKTVEEDAVHTTLVKRIVGMPGERIHIEDGKVFADGVPLEIPDFLPKEQHYTSPRDRYSNFRYGILEEDEFAVIPEGHYLVLGDNSAYSRDGRVFGWLPNEHIMGRVSCIWWPPTRWNDFTGFSSTLWWRTLLALIGAYTLFRLFIGRSWGLPHSEERGDDHYLLLFTAFGLRIPFTLGWVARWAKPQRGDLVLYAPDSPHAEAGAQTVGRIVALPGERVSIEEGGININDKAIALDGFNPEKIVSTHPDAIYGRGKNKKNNTVPEGNYFILSETPDEEHALDSRTLGWVPERRILARAKCVWWPLSRMRKLP